VPESIMSPIYRTIRCSTRRLPYVALAAAAMLPAEFGAAQVVLADETDAAFVNNSIGTLLNGTSQVNNKQHFPIQTDPTNSFGPTEGPDLFAAESVLGDWLDPENPDFSTSGWIFEENPTSDWQVGTELAVAYRFEVESAQNLVASVGVDNGVYVWLNGRFIGGELRPGFAVPGEHIFDLGDLDAGIHHVQFILEDHGVTNDFNLTITADAVILPEPSTCVLLTAGGNWTDAL